MMKKVLVTIIGGLALLYGVRFLLLELPFSFQEAGMFNQPCEFETERNNGIRLSFNRTAAFMTGKKEENGLAVSTIEHSSGKYYFEMEYVCKVCGNSMPATLDAGVFWNGSTSRHRPPELVVGNSDWFYGVNLLKYRPRRLRDGDIVGVAVNLDDGKIFFRQNEVWLICQDVRYRERRSGDPAEPDSGLSIPTNRSYSAALYIKPKMFHFAKIGWVANFGQKEFVFPMPVGYSSWDKSLNQPVTDTLKVSGLQKNLGWQAATPRGVAISEDGTQFRHSGEKDPWLTKQGKTYLPGRAIATKSHSQGKWYVEVTYLDGDPSTPISDETVLGLQSSLASYFKLSNSDPGWAGQKTQINYKGKKQLKDGDVICIALDLENLKYYAVLNGQWRDSNNPTSQDSGINLRKPSEWDTDNTYMFVAEIAYAKDRDSSDVWEVNTGNSEFKYKIPKGFKPY